MVTRWKDLPGSGPMGKRNYFFPLPVPPTKFLQLILVGLAQATCSSLKKSSCDEGDEIFYLTRLGPVPPSGVGDEVSCDVQGLKMGERT